MNKKKLIAILTLVCFMFTLMPVAAMAEEESTETTYDAIVSVSTEAELRDALTNDKYIGKSIVVNVTQNIELATFPISIDSGVRTILLQSAENENGDVYKIKGGASVKDVTDGTPDDDVMFRFNNIAGCFVDMTLKNIVIDVNQKGRGFWVKSSEQGEGQHKLTLDDGSILENAYIKKRTGAAVQLDSSTLVMDGGIIRNSITMMDNGGGAVLLYNRASNKKTNFIMNDGLITGCSGGYGAVVAPWTYGDVILRGGSITNNYTLSTGNSLYAGGVFVDMGYKTNFIIGGDMSITNNYACSKATVDAGNGIESNIYFNNQGTATEAVNRSFTVEDDFTGEFSIATMTGSNFADNKYTRLYIKANKEKVSDLLEKISIRKNYSDNPELTFAWDGNDKVRLHLASTVTFNNGEEKVTQLVPKEIETMLDENAFEKTGYTFAGWSTTADGEVVYEDGATATFSTDTTLYAQWIPEVYDITYVLNNGTNDVDAPKTHTYDSATTLPTPTRDGYDFDGWYTDEALTQKVEILGATDYTSDITLYAKWIGHPYKILFNGNGGTSTTTMSALDMKYGEAKQLTANTFTKVGFNFAGWSSTTSGAMEYEDETVVKIDTPVTNNEMTLYAVWTAKDVLSPTVEKQSYVYDGNAQAYALNDYTVSYEQNGQAVTPINVGVYDVVVSRAEDDTYAAYTNTFTGALEITKATPTLTLTASETDVKGAKTITLTATASGLCGSDTGVITLDAPAGLTVTDKGNGVYEVALPNSTANYTFTANLDAGTNYNEVSDDVTVTVTRKSSSTSNDSGATASKPQATVTTPNKEVTVTKKAVSNTVINKAEREVASDKDVQVIGGTISAVNITAKENGTIMTSFTEPLTVTVPVSKAAMNDVDDVSKLTLAKVVTSEDGSTDIIYVGGNYDTQKGTFTALVDEPGDYILVENANIQKIELQIGNADYTVNGNERTNDTAPINYNNRTLVAIRYIAEIFGAEVGWDPETYTVTIEIDGKVLTMVIDEQIPGFDTPAILHNNRTMVPLRYISEAVGAKVIYVPSTQGIIVVK